MVGSEQVTVRLGERMAMAETLNFVDFERATVARLGELAMAVIRNSTGFGQTVVARLTLDGTGWVVVRVRFDGFERAVAEPRGGFGQVAMGLNSN